MAYVYVRAVRATIFSNGSIIPPGFKFTKLYALTLAARSYALLLTATPLGLVKVIFVSYIPQRLTTNTLFP